MSSMNRSRFSGGDMKCFYIESCGRSILPLTTARKKLRMDLFDYNLRFVNVNA